MKGDDKQALTIGQAAVPLSSRGVRGVRGTGLSGSGITFATGSASAPADSLLTGLALPVLSCSGGIATAGCPADSAAGGCAALLTGSSCELTTPAAPPATAGLAAVSACPCGCCATAKTAAPAGSPSCLGLSRGALCRSGSAAPCCTDGNGVCSRTWAASGASGRTGPGGGELSSASLIAAADSGVACGSVCLQKHSTGPCQS